MKQMSEQKPLVGILMGSDNDYEIMIEAGKALKELGIGFEMIVSSDIHGEQLGLSGLVLGSLHGSVDQRQRLLQW